jgi:hypothetical protein
MVLMLMEMLPVRLFVVLWPAMGLKIITVIMIVEIVVGLSMEQEVVTAIASLVELHVPVDGIDVIALDHKSTIHAWIPVILTTVTVTDRGERLMPRVEIGPITTAGNPAPLVTNGQDFQTQVTLVMPMRYKQSIQPKHK